MQGIACEEKWTYETKRLAEVLKNKEDIRTDFYITATYDSPFQLVCSRNEIWFVKFDRKTNSEQINKEMKMLKYGSQKVEVPSVLGWILQMVMVYLTVVFYIGRSTLNCSVLLRDNWDSVKQRLHLLSKIMLSNVSIGGLLRCAWMAWSVVLAVILGTAAEKPKSFQKKSYTNS